MSTKGLYPGLFRPNQNSRLRRLEYYGSTIWTGGTTYGTPSAPAIHTLILPNSVGAIRVCVIGAGGSGGIDATTTGNPGWGGGAGGVAWNLIIPIHGPSMLIFLAGMGHTANTAKLQIYDSGRQGHSAIPTPIWSIECAAGNAGADASAGSNPTQGGNCVVYHHNIVYVNSGTGITTSPPQPKPFLNGFVCTGATNYTLSGAPACDFTGIFFGGSSTNRNIGAPSPLGPNGTNFSSMPPGTGGIGSTSTVYDYTRSGGPSYVRVEWYED